MRWTVALALFTLVAGSGCMVDVQLEGKRCSAERDCSAGYLCVEGICVDVEALRPCANDNGCSPGEVCGSGYCVRAVPSDGGAVDDAGPLDAGLGDAGPPDGGRSDAGPGDGGVIDDSGPLTDAGPRSDAGPDDDAGDAPLDAGEADAADPCPNDPLDDVDTDGLCGDVDNCPSVPNPEQTDLDQDGVGDACQGFAPPPCDHRLTPGALDAPANGGNDNGSDDFDELEAYLATRADLDLDGTIAVCLADGVDITTIDATTGDRISIPKDNVLLMGEAGGTASIRNLRVDDLGDSWANWQAHSGVVISGHVGLSLHNLRMSVASQEGRVVHTDYTGTAKTFSRLVITAFEYHSEGIHTRGPVDEIVDVTITTTGDYGYGIEPQATGDIGSIRRVSITTQGQDAHGIGAFVTEGASVDEIVGVEITTSGLNAHGLYLGDGAIIGRMEHSTLRRGASASTPASAIEIEEPPNGTGFVTANVHDNVVCSVSGGDGWTRLLSQGGIAYSLPTVPYLGESGPFGAKTFPWGDADDVNDDGSLQWNQQAQWGGDCP